MKDILPTIEDAEVIEEKSPVSLENEAICNTRNAAELNTHVEHEMTVLEAVRLYPKAVLWVFVLSLAIVMEGYDVGLIPNLWAQAAFQRNYGVKQAHAAYQLRSVYQSLLTAVLQVGSIIGYLISGVVIDRFGYKPTLHGCLALCIAFVFVVFFAPNVHALIVGEGLLGVPWGIIQTLTTTYAAEVAPVKLRPIVTTYICMCWMIGQFISVGVLRGFVSNDTQWAYRIPFAIQWIWPLPIMLAVAFAPESPWYLVRKGRIEEAKHSLLSLVSRKHTTYNPDAAIAMIKQTIESERSLEKSGGYIECFRGTNLRRTEITCVAGAVPFLAGSSFGGMVVYFLRSAGLAAKNAFNVGLGMNAFNMVAVVASWFLVSRFGRRTLYLGALVCTSTLLLLIGILGTLPAHNMTVLWATGGLMILYMFIYMSCLGAVAYVVVGEMPSSQLRNKTVALARIFLNLLNFAGSWLNPALVNPSALNLRGKGAFVWAGISIFTTIWAYFRFPETSGRTFGEIDDLFQRRIPTRKFKTTLANASADKNDEEL